MLTFWSIWFYNYSSRTIFSPILPKIETELEIGHASAGGLFSFISIGYGLGLLLADPFMRWLSPRRLLLFGHGSLVLFMGLFFLVRGYYFFALLCLLIGFAAGVYLPCAIPLLVDQFTSHHWAKVMGFHGTAPPVSLFVIPLAISLLLEISSWKFIIFLFFLMGIPLLPALERLTRGSPDSTLPTKPEYASLLKDKKIWALSLIHGFAASANLGIYAIIPLFLVSERGFTLFKANQLLAISRVGGIVVPFLVGAIADRFGNIKTLISVMILSGLFTILMAMSHQEIFLTIFLFLQTSIIVGFFPLSFTLTVKTVGHANRGPAVALVTGFGAVCMALTPWLLGVIADYSNFSYGMVAIGVSTMCIPILLRAFR